MLWPVLEGGRDGSGEEAPDDGNKDLKLDGKRKSFFFWPDMVVASKCLL